jgi:hypothetical protein
VSVFYLYLLHINKEEPIKCIHAARVFINELRKSDEQPLADVTCSPLAIAASLAKRCFIGKQTFSSAKYAVYYQTSSDEPIFSPQFSHA